MTDKQIIIDGVDVSGCPHYIIKDGSCSSHDCECVKCVHNICFYKDYKAKEQECEELKRQHQGDKGLITSTGKMNYQLLQEYDKMKTALTEIKEIAERDKEFCIKCNGDKEIDCIDCIEGGRALLAKEILQKISECEVK